MQSSAFHRRFPGKAICINYLNSCHNRSSGQSKACKTWYWRGWILPLPLPLKKARSCFRADWGSGLTRPLVCHPHCHKSSPTTNCCPNICYPLPTKVLLPHQSVPPHRSPWIFPNIYIGPGRPSQPSFHGSGKAGVGSGLQYYQAVSRKKVICLLVVLTQVTQLLAWWWIHSCLVDSALNPGRETKCLSFVVLSQ